MTTGTFSALDWNDGYDDDTGLFTFGDTFNGSVNTLDAAVTITEPSAT